jgi:hypothetical protein
MGQTDRGGDNVNISPFIQLLGGETNLNPKKDERSEESEEEKKRRLDESVRQIQNIVSTQMLQSRLKSKNGQIGSSAIAAPPPTLQPHQPVVEGKVLGDLNQPSYNASYNTYESPSPKKTPSKRIKNPVGRPRKKKALQTAAIGLGVVSSNLSHNPPKKAKRGENMKKVKEVFVYPSKVGESPYGREKRQQQSPHDIPRPNGFATLMDVLPRVHLHGPPPSFKVPDAFVYNACLLPGLPLDQDADDASREVLSMVFGNHLPFSWSNT